ncbi:MAG: response regulator [Bacteriovoracaceae bacterium]|jgi:CheY-like chemotaxis protein|nr:response regulator [Bacteriovoracaceae bacterium]
MKILLIEDDPTIQRALSKLMEKRGATVVKESSGKAAIELILQNNYDKIICDLMLQDIHGFDILEEAKQKYSSGQIKKMFIIITAYSSTQVLDKAASYGCQLFAKPFDDLPKVLDIFVKKL